MTGRTGVFWERYIMAACFGGCTEEELAFMAVLTDEYRNSVCEIKSMRNDLLTTGRIYSINEDEIEFVHPEDDKMPLLPYNTPVKIGVFNSRHGFRMLAGTVFISTDLFLRVSNLKTLQDFERRGFFRTSVHLESRAYPMVVDKEGEEAVQEEVRPYQIIIEDISLSGLQISCEERKEIGDALAVEVQIFKKKMMFHCRIMRQAKESDHRHYYGCSFFDQTERQIDDLCYDLFQLQRMEIRKRRNA